MTRSKEKWQAHMNRVGASALRNETAELSQYFSQFGGVNVGSDFETVDPQCYAPGGAPGCDFGEDEYEDDEWDDEDEFGEEEEFALTKIPAGIQLPPSWGVPDPSMVRPGETPEGWDSNLFLGETGTALFLGED